MPPDTCPNCGAALPRKAKACPECGADETSGWSETGDTGHLGLPEEDFDFAEFARQEFGGGGPKPRGIHWFWWVAAVLVLAVMVWFLIL
jgi:hypothetical protein